MMAGALSAMVLAIFALVGGALFLLRRGGARKQVMLMLALAAILAVNVGLWTVPGSDGTVPVDQQTPR